MTENAYNVGWEDGFTAGNKEQSTLNRDFINQLRETIVDLNDQVERQERLINGFIAENRRLSDQLGRSALYGERISDFDDWI